MRIHLLHLFAAAMASATACGGPPPTGQATDPHGSQTFAAAPTDAAPPPPAPVDRGCIADAAAEQACAARGAGFAYQPEPYIYCSGVAPRPEDEQAEFARIRNSPCQCVDLQAVAQRREACSRVP